MEPVVVTEPVGRSGLIAIGSPYEEPIPLSSMTVDDVDVDVERPTQAPSWYLQVPLDSRAAVGEAVDEADTPPDIGAYYRDRAAQFRGRPGGPNDDDEWDSTLF
jgi:hypothetical protein